MALEFQEKNKYEKSSEMMVTGINNDGSLIYEEMKVPLAPQYAKPPEEAFRAITADFNKLKATGEKMKFSQGEILYLAINSDKKVRYAISHVKNGYYLLSKIDIGLIVPNISKCEVVLSKDPRDKINPDLIVCTEREITSWMKG